MTRDLTEIERYANEQQARAMARLREQRDKERRDKFWFLWLSVILAVAFAVNVLYECQTAGKKMYPALPGQAYAGER